VLALGSDGEAREEIVPIQPPSRAELARIAEAYHLSLSEDELATFAELAGPTLAASADSASCPTRRCRSPIRAWTSGIGRPGRRTRPTA
jgi:hypothetical protein